jgi:hypothetical protein
MAQPVNPSQLIGTLVSHLNGNLRAPSIIISNFHTEIDILNRANEDAQSLYDKTTVDGLQKLLTAERQNLADALRQINIQVITRLSDFNDNLGKYFDDLKIINESALQFESRVYGYEVDLANYDYTINKLKSEIDDYKQVIRHHSIVVVPSSVPDDDDDDPSPAGLTADKKKRTNLQIWQICSKIKFRQPLTVKAFNNLHKLIITNDEKVSEDTLWSWRKKTMEAYAHRIAVIGEPIRQFPKFDEAEFLLIMRAILLFVKNNGAGAKEIPDKL